MKDLKELVKEGEMGEDDERRAEDELQKLTDEHVHQHRRAAQAQGSGDPRGLSSGAGEPGSRTWPRCGPGWRAGGCVARRAPLSLRPAAPTCRYVAIIMDGNGRWAQRRRLPVAAGHRAGAKTLRRVIEHALDLGVRELTVYSFSTENWSRPRGRGRRRSWISSSR